MFIFLSYHARQIETTKEIKTRGWKPHALCKHILVSNPGGEGGVLASRLLDKIRKKQRKENENYPVYFYILKIFF
jgi:hypothetical protein